MRTRSALALLVPLVAACTTLSGIADLSRGASPAALPDGASPPDDAGPGAPLGDGGDGGCAGDLSSDPRNCGTCGNACGGADACYGGVCGGNRIAQLAAGYWSSCVRLVAGEIWCWGHGGYGELGVDPSTLGTCPLDGAHCRAAPAKLPGITDAVDISVGLLSGCLVRKGGDLLCFGLDNIGQLGHPASIDRTCPSGGYTGACNWTPTKVAGLPPITKVAASTTVCAIADDGRVFCFGANHSGELGRGSYDTAFHPDPQPVAGVTHAVDVGVSGEEYDVNSVHVCVKKDDGTLLCWGDNEFGQLGVTPGANCTVTARPCSATPVAVMAGGGNALANVDKLAVTNGATCATVGMNQSLYCWGSRSFGVAGGPSDNVAHPSPAPLAGARATDLSGFAAHACIVGLNGDPYCWGVNDTGAVGVGTFGGSDTLVAGASIGYVAPQKAFAAGGFVQIAAGEHSTLALDKKGNLWAWGENGYGQDGHDAGSAGDVVAHPFNHPMLPVPSNPTPSKVAGLP